ncbi:MAG: AgmX/PglI C-terminal domain-containing protein [Pseudomonadota bacterium]
MRTLVSTLSWLLALALVLTVSSADAARKKGKKAPPDATKGTLPKEKIIKVIKEHKDALKHCYLVQQELKPELEGSVTLRWKIYPEGEVQQVEVSEATLDDKDVHACLKDEIGGWTFTKPKGGVVTVTFPFQFRPPPKPPEEAKPDEGKDEEKGKGKDGEEKKDEGDGSGKKDDGMNFGGGDLEDLFPADKPAKKKAAPKKKGKN